MPSDGIASYVIEHNAHLNKYHSELDDLHALVEKRALLPLEYRALERLLQLSIEASIGLAKHWVKDFNGAAPNDAYQSFKMLKDKMHIDETELLLWQKIIGMRNALVHDYLDIDEAAVTEVLKNKKYVVMFDFYQLAAKHLS